MDISESLDLYCQNINYIEDHHYHMNILISYIEKNKHDTNKMRNMLKEIKILMGVMRNITLKET